MEGKVAVSLIVFLFPALIVPLFIIFFLTRIPGAWGTFFADYSYLFLWGTYLLLAVAGVFLYRYFKRLTTRQELARAAAQDAAAKESRSSTVPKP